MANRILVAEDVLELRSTLEISLKLYCRENDVEILTAATREEALSIIASTNGIAVVVTDLRMPDFGDGEAVAIAAQQKGIKVIVLSGTLSDLSETVRGNCLAILDKQTASAKDVADVINSSLKS